MSEQEPTITTWKETVSSWVKPLLMPALFLGAGILLIAALGMAQRFGWIAAGDGDGQPVPAEATKKDDVQYICPMMCTPPLGAPGRCPVCGMELVPASAEATDSETPSITIDAATRRVANIQTAPVLSKPVSRQVRTVGRISYDEGKLKTLAAYVDGRIDRLYADYTGVVVNKGDELALLYSPELYTAQTELLAAKRAVRRVESSAYSEALDSRDLVERARRKLRDLGLTEQQIARLEETEEPVTRINLVAPIHGTVIARMAAEGEYVKTGQPIYRLADLSTVWLMLELFPADAATIRYGQRVEARVESLPGKTFTGRVAFVDPMVDPETRTIGVRVVIQNDNQQLKVGDYATATIETPIVTATKSKDMIYDPKLAGKWISPRHPHIIEEEPGECEICGIDLVPASRFGFAEEPIGDREELVVPRNAVLMAGDNSVVYVETEPGQFELRRVTLGPSVGDEIVLLDGVKAGEQVATNGNFLIDSQMQLSGKPSLIDPTKASTTPSTDESAKDPVIDAALAKLPEEDRELAREQRICPVTEAPLGSMGVPKKVNVDGRTILICCEGCRQPLLDHPDKYLAVLEEQADDDGKAGRDSPRDSAAPSSDLPPIGPIQPLAEENSDPPPTNPIRPLDEASDDGPAEAEPTGPTPPIAPIRQEASP